MRCEGGREGGCRDRGFVPRGEKERTRVLIYIGRGNACKLHKYHGWPGIWFDALSSTCFLFYSYLLRDSINSCLFFQPLGPPSSTQTLRKKSWVLLAPPQTPHWTPSFLFPIHVASIFIDRKIKILRVNCGCFYKWLLIFNTVKRYKRI